MVTSIQGSMQNQGIDWRTNPARADQAEAAHRAGKLQAGYGSPTMKISMEVSISAKAETMRLLLQSVMTNVGEAIKPYVAEPPANASGPAPVQPGAVAGGAPVADAGGVDNSPEATAQRILSFATGFYESFKAQHGDMQQPAMTDHFLDVIKGGIEQGFKEAREILQGLGVLQGTVASNIDKTYELIQKGLAEFRAQILPQETKSV